MPFTSDRRERIVPFSATCAQKARRLVSHGERRRKLSAWEKNNSQSNREEAYGPC